MAPKKSASRIRHLSEIINGRSQRVVENGNRTLIRKDGTKVFFDSHLVVVREISAVGDGWLAELCDMRSRSLRANCIVRIGLCRDRLLGRGPGKIEKKWFHRQMTCPESKMFCTNKECLQVMWSGGFKDKAKRIKHCQRVNDDRKKLYLSDECD